MIGKQKWDLKKDYHVEFLFCPHITLSLPFFIAMYHIFHCHFPNDSFSYEVMSSQEHITL